jgi:hypothetical protein
LDENSGILFQMLLLRSLSPSFMSDDEDSGNVSEYEVALFFRS